MDVISDKQAVQAASPYRVPLKGAYVGLACAPWLALAHSTISPLLVLKEDAIETRVIWPKRERSYAALSWYAVRKGCLQTAVVLAFAGSCFTFGGVVANASSADEVADELKRRGCFRVECR